MKAAQISQYGDTSVISINEIDKPSLGDDQVLVEVYSASLNPFDTIIHSGQMKDTIPLELPVTLGGDIAGVVVGVGSSVTNLAAGDRVYGQANVVAGNSGAFAEFAATSAKQIAKIPANLDFDKAAALPLVSVSALQALKQHIKLQAGQKIFIHGGAGGIGTIAVQIAKKLGAYVATTATGEGIDFVKKLGADEVIDYKTQDFARILKDYDAVFDCVGGNDFMKSLSILKKGAVAVSMIAPVDEPRASELGVKALTQSTHVTNEALEDIVRLVDAHVIRSHVDKVFTLSQVKKAFEARESGKIKGKVVLKVK